MHQVVRDYPSVGLDDDVEDFVTETKGNLCGG